MHLDGSRGLEVSRVEVIEAPSGGRRRTKVERARIAADSLMPQGDDCWCCTQARHDALAVLSLAQADMQTSLMLPASVVALPMAAELVVVEPEQAPSAAGGGSDIAIEMGDIVNLLITAPATDRSMHPE